MVTFKAGEISESDMRLIRKVKIDMGAKNNAEYLIKLVKFYHRKRGASDVW